MRLLQWRDDYGYIVCCFKVLSLVIFEIFLFNVSEKLGVKGSEMVSDEGVVAVDIHLYDFGWERSRVSDIVILAINEIWVDEPSIFFLEVGVEHFEDLLSEKLIITVNYHENLFRITELVCGSSEVEHGSFFLSIFDDLVSIFWYFILVFEKVWNEVTCLIGWSIIEYNDIIIVIILHDDWSNVS